MELPEDRDGDDDDYEYGNKDQIIDLLLLTARWRQNLFLFRL